MTTSLVAPAPVPLGSGHTNSADGSQVAAKARWPDGLLFFNPADNELLMVSRAEVAAVLAEINLLEQINGDLWKTKQAVLQGEEALQLLRRQRFPNLTEIQRLESALQVAQRRYDAAYEEMRKNLGDQGYLTGASNGKDLLELIPLAQRARAGGPATVWNRKMTYVRSDKMKNHWRQYKLGPGDKGQNQSFVKNGRIDSHALKEQFTKIEPKLKADWGLMSGHLFPQLQGWAEAMRTEDPLTDDGNVMFRSEAHLFRYFVGCGAEGSWAPREGKIAAKGNGKAEIQIARAEASIECVYPSKEGWGLALVGVKSGTTFHIGAMRLMATLKVSAGAGASVAAELGVEVDYSAAMGGRKGAPIKGKRRKGQATPRELNLSQDLGGGASAGVEAFAGAKAGGELLGGLQFRNPEKNEQFDWIAAIGPKLEGQAGVGAGANFMISYTGGKFRIRAKAAVCIGLGAKGELAMEVGAKQLVGFLQHLFHALLNANFELLEVIHQRAYEVATQLQVLLVNQTQQVERAIRDGVDLTQQVIEDAWEKFAEQMEREDRRLALMERVLSNPPELRICTPEAHGILLHQLTRHGSLTKAMPANTGLNFELLYRRKQAVLQVCRWAQTKRQFENIVQHISPTAAKGGFKGNLDGLKRFLEIGPGESRLDDDLQALYDRLPDHPASGHAVAMNHTPRFMAQAKVGPSPTYLAMLGDGLSATGNVA
ncbi:hypothetical protein ACVNIS_16765 [Sphaerotilaceae bacterium SBD11-9]